jgi:Raf kinase inhibitor-like YbhB/YbcL family protein
MPINLKTPSFPQGGRIPARFTCDGGDASPRLLWSGAPAGTRSFALICRDPDAPSGTFYHWAIYDIGVDVDGLPEHCPRQIRGGAAVQGGNDFDLTGYSGPCPPRGHGPHRYIFRLYALDVERLPLKAPARARAVEQIAEAHALAHAEVMGVYER